jgi:hypothetical protein
MQVHPVLKGFSDVAGGVVRCHNAIAALARMARQRARRWLISNVKDLASWVMAQHADAPPRGAAPEQHMPAVDLVFYPAGIRYML